MITNSRKIRAQLSRYWSLVQKIPGSIPLGGKKYFQPLSDRKEYNKVYPKKLQICHELVLCMRRFKKLSKQLQTSFGLLHEKCPNKQSD